MSKEQLIEELEKQGLSEVVRSDIPNDLNAGINVDYFLRLINCTKLMSSQVQKDKYDEFIAKRREAYKVEDWESYAQISGELFNF